MNVIPKSEILTGISLTDIKIAKFVRWVDLHDTRNSSVEVRSSWIPSVDQVLRGKRKDNAWYQLSKFQRLKNNQKKSLRLVLVIFKSLEFRENVFSMQYLQPVLLVMHEVCSLGVVRNTFSFYQVPRTNQENYNYILISTYHALALIKCKLWLTWSAHSFCVTLNIAILHSQLLL